MSESLIIVSSSPIAMPPYVVRFSSPLRLLPFSIVFLMIAAIFFVAWLSTSFIFWVIG